MLQGVLLHATPQIQAHLLLDQMGAYFRRTSTGRMRAGRIVPEPFFVHSDLTTGILVADLAAYILSWNVRLAKRKVRVFEQCSHPAVVPFLDVGTSGGMHYLAWTFVQGETLDKIVEREGKLSANLAAR